MDAVDGTHHRSLAIAQLRLDGGTQLRERVVETQVDNIVDAIDAGGAIPPVRAMHDGRDYWLWDGFHRVTAFVRLGRDRIDVEISSGDVDSARVAAARANKENLALPRSREDKLRAIRACLESPRFAGNSARLIAEHVGVTVPTVLAEIERRAKATAKPTVKSIQLSPDPRERSAAPSAVALPAKTVGRDGRARANLGQRVAGARRALDNAITKASAATSLLELEAIRAAVAQRLPDVPASEGATKSQEAERVYAERKRKLEAEADREHAERETKRRAPAGVRIPTVSISDATHRARALVRFAQNFDMGVRETLAACPLARMSDADRATCIAALLATAQLATELAAIAPTSPGSKGEPSA